MNAETTPSQAATKPVRDDAGILAEEEAYWRKTHDAQVYAKGRGYDQFRSAYRAGISGYVHGRTFEEQEDPLRKEYESMKESRGNRSLEEEAIEQLEWEEARHATRAAYEWMAGRKGGA